MKTNSNKHSEQIPDAVISQVSALLDQAIAALMPYLLALTAEERRNIPKMGEKTLSFMEKAHEFAADNAAFQPPFFSMADFSIDYADARSLLAVLSKTLQLHEMIGDTAMTAGSEAYQAALQFYASVKALAAQDVPGARALYEELRTRFPRGKRSAA